MSGPVVTGNIYGGRVTRLGLRVVQVGYDPLGTGNLMAFDSRIGSFDVDGEPYISRVGTQEPARSNAYSYVSTTTEADIAGMSDGTWTWPVNTRELIWFNTQASIGSVTASIGQGRKGVVTYTRNTPGGTSLTAQCMVTGAVTVGAQAKLLVTGGIYNATQIGPTVDVPALANGTVTFAAPILLAAGAATDYVLSLQVQASGLVSAITVATGSARIGMFEYHG